jgi:hypothetical protein
MSKIALVFFFVTSLASAKYSNSSMLHLNIAKMDNFLKIILVCLWLYCIRNKLTHILSYIFRIFVLSNFISIITS